MATTEQDTTVPPLPWIEVCESGDWWINTDNDEAFDGGWVCNSDPGVFRNQATLEFMLKTVNAHDGLVAALQEVKRDVERAYTNNVIWPSTMKQIDAALNAAQGTTDHE